jgi:hypothetical protein
VSRMRLTLQKCWLLKSMPQELKPVFSATLDFWWLET